eukprot:2075115-Amphidinium_carterae.1
MKPQLTHVLCTCQTRARSVGPYTFPLRIGKLVHSPRLQTVLALGHRVPRVSVSFPVDCFTTKMLQQQSRPVWSTPIEQPSWEGSHDKDIFATPYPACNDRADGGIRALVDIEVKDHRRKRLAL